jgi:hypothetical protein
MKAVSQVDFIVAIGIFLIATIFIVNYMTDFVTPLKEVSESENIRQRAFFLMNTVKKDSAIGLYTTAYRTSIKIENTRKFLINTSHPIIDLNQEALKLNLSKINFTDIDKFSVVVYNDSQRENTIDYLISDDLIIFNASIKSDEIKTFYIYFDDDSNFTDRTKYSNITNRLNEIIYPVEQFAVLQYKKIEALSVSDYEYLKSIADGDFRIEILDLATGSTMSIGADAPSHGDVVVLDEKTLLQTEDAQIHDGVLKIYVW